MDPLAALLLVAVLFIGAAFGFWLGGRPVAEWKARHAQRDGEARDLDAKFLRNLAELEAAKERALRVATLETELLTIRTERDRHATDLATHKATRPILRSRSACWWKRARNC